MEAISECLIPLELELQATRKVLRTESGCSWGTGLRSLQEEQYALLTMELILQSQNSPFKNFFLH